jgi:cation transport regulator ChaC
VPLDASELRWFFAHGSVMFDPRFRYAEKVRATVAGWERRFGHPSTRNWGVPGAPAPTCSLVPGREVTGVGFGVEPASFPVVVDVLLRREAQEPIVVEMSVGDATVIALTWPMSAEWAHLNPDELARAATVNVSAGGGPAGNAMDYLRGVAGVLESMGATDGVTRRYVAAAVRSVADGAGDPDEGTRRMLRP